MTHGTQSTAGETVARFALLSDTGQVRAHNEDACAADAPAGLFVLCDGMGGAAAGEVASQMASAVFLERAGARGPGASLEQRLRTAVDAANGAVFAQSRRSPQLEGMGTTLVAVQLDPAAAAVWTINVGDSRCYRLRDGRLQALTADHSYVDEQLRLGNITPLEASNSPYRHVITRAVGSRAAIDADVVQHDAASHDLFLLCSDGLTGELTDEEIATILSANGDDLDAAASALVRLANDHGGADNITVILIRI